MSTDASTSAVTAERATVLLQEGYPRPQLVRDSWVDLTGEWAFSYDDDDEGQRRAWYRTPEIFDRRIQVPFPPESPASRIGDNQFHPVVWYQRALSLGHITSAASADTRTVLHFGAVDYRADVWLNGHYLGHHEGGHTPFNFDITDQIGPDSQAGLVVRAADDPHDVAQPRGKQDWQPEPHGIWYHRTTGIWQPVWAEVVPATHIENVTWVPDLASGQVELHLELSSRPSSPVTVHVSLAHGGEALADMVFTQTEPRSSNTITIAQQANGQAYEALLWSPEHPRLIDATIGVHTADGAVDDIYSYLGLRSVDFAGGHFMLNDRPYYIRAVLEQGYWPESHLAAPHLHALQEEVQLAKDLGFNTVRIHEKIEDPRYLYWADRLGLLVWSESPSCFEYSVTAVERSIREWMDNIRRDMSHPCIVAWVPLNESWGVQHIAHQPAPLSYARSLYHLTKALDPTRLVVSNDGWEHAESDLWTIHDYSVTGAELRANYADRPAVDALLDGIGPLGRRMKLLDLPERGQPIVVSEFGGISYAPAQPHPAWGYVTAQEPAELQELLSEHFHALQASPILAGFCYTQLTDTLQEVNGLADGDRKPKLPADIVKSIVLGLAVDTSTHRRPKKPVERPVELA